MNMVVTVSAAERLRLYRSRHRIEIDASGDWTTCETDGIKVYAVRGRQWRHDQDQITKLERDAYAESTRVALAIERISADFTAELDEDEPDFDRESQPEFNGAFR